VPLHHSSTFFAQSQNWQKYGIYLIISWVFSARSAARERQKLGLHSFVACLLRSGISIQVLSVRVCQITTERFPNCELLLHELFRLLGSYVA
jgi:hypothetical protein